MLCFLAASAALKFCELDTKRICVVLSMKPKLKNASPLISIFTLLFPLNKVDIQASIPIYSFSAAICNFQNFTQVLWSNPICRVCQASKPKPLISLYYLNNPKNNRDNPHLSSLCRFSAVHKQSPVYATKFRHYYYFKFYYYYDMCITNLCFMT